MEVTVEIEDDPFPQAAKADHALALDRGDRRVEGPQQERAPEAQLPERLPDDARLQRGQIGDDVGKLGHREGE